MDEAAGGKEPYFYDEEIERLARAWHAEHCRVSSASYWPPNDEWWGRLWEFYCTTRHVRLGGTASPVTAAFAAQQAAATPPQTP